MGVAVGRAWRHPPRRRMPSRAWIVQANSPLPRLPTAPRSRWDTARAHDRRAAALHRCHEICPAPDFDLLPFRRRSAQKLSVRVGASGHFLPQCFLLQDRSDTRREAQAGRLPLIHLPEQFPGASPATRRGCSARRECCHRRARRSGRRREPSPPPGAGGLMFPRICGELSGFIGTFQARDPRPAGAVVRKAKGTALR